MKNISSEIKREIPGDSDFSANNWFTDQSLFIKASADKIWPWLAQMGNNRAGWYSYDWLDNFAKPSFEHIDMSLQNIFKGQKLMIGEISDFSKNQFITFKFGHIANYTLILFEKDGSTELLTRIRCKGPKVLLNYTLGVGHFVMQKKQLMEIKRRVEK